MGDNQVMTVEITAKVDYSDIVYLTVINVEFDLLLKRFFFPGATFYGAV